MRLIKIILFLTISFIITISIQSQTFGPKTSGTGLKPDSYDLLSSIKEANPNRIAHRGLPSKVDLSDLMPPVGNQGQQSSCVAWSTAYANKSYQEFIERKDKGTWNYKTGNTPNYKNLFSPAFIYNQINGGRDNGSSISDAMALIVSKGVLPWDAMPYNEKNFSKQPTAEHLSLAAKFKAKEFLRLRYNEPSEIKNHLSQGRPVVVGILINENFYEIGKKIYNEGKGANLGGHAITLVGYDDSTNAFKFQNSWGVEWGDKGFGYIDYKYFAKVCRSAFVMIDLIDPNPEPQIVDNKIKPTPPENTVLPPTDINPPSEINASNGNFSNKIVLTWMQVPGAIGYEIYRSNPDDDNFQQIGLSQNTQFEDTGVLPEIAYSYKITAVSETDVSDLSQVTAIGYAKDTKNEIPPKITSITATDGKFSDKIILEWEPLENVTGYQIFKWDSATKTYRAIAKTNSTIYEDRTAKKNGTLETYTVAGLNNSITGILSDAVMGKTSLIAKPQAPDRVVASMGQFRDKIVVKWNKVSGATGYLVYKFVDNKWETLGETAEDQLEDAPATRGQRYYTVIAKNKDNIWGPFSRYAVGYVDPNLRRGGSKLEPPSGVSATVDKKNGFATITWHKVDGAEEYNIWEKKQGESKWNFKSRVDSNKLFYTFTIPEREKFYLYSVTSKTQLGTDSDYSNVASVVLSTAKIASKTRSFGGASKFEKFTGTWTAMQWDGNVGTKNVIMEITQTDGNNFTVKIDNKKTFKGSYVQGSPIIDIDGKIKIKLASSEDALMVEMKDKSIVNEKTELSFLKE
ncbi:MAG TPA: C1 family peptidase [Leptospiraceae bacterium]|nr:C1 family peptidase [Leptospiraceae bacterium]HMX31860.1 C1 family peptidase [Leptospiraceae bacterium]HMY29727.1 C1 family peptidase [Leptospiraceae bacterium]HMZ62874.1 C1 family peptidase [Leptospiraceae bacterium]HNA07902.1 C1 family peptidase [Leptospiraceae bacterium]